MNPFAPCTFRHPAPVVGVLLALALAPLPAAAQALLDCMIQPHQVVLVGAPAPGVVERVLVERGDTVRRGQVLVQMQAHVERAALALAHERSQQAGEARSAEGSRTLAQRELERANELYSENFVSRNFVDRARAEAEVAGGRSEQAGERRRMSTREVDLAQAQLALRTIRAPMDGVVVDRLLGPGEFVDQKPLLRLAAVNPLRVDVLVPASAFGVVQVGAKASVVPDLLQREPRAATVRTVDRVIDAASNSFRVRLELPNPEGALPAGLRCKVDLGLPAALARAGDDSLRLARP